VPNQTSAAVVVTASSANPTRRQSIANVIDTYNNAA
jgi:hypothetical protein